MGLYIFLCAVLVATLATFANGQTRDYCALSSCRENMLQHTMCVIKSDRPAPRCGKVYRVGLTREQKQELVNAHNTYRAKVARGEEYRGRPGPQPPAVNMQPLVWDDELAKVAQRWANQCQFNHDKCRDVDRFYVGQNLGIKGSTSNSTEFSITSYVTSWVNEVNLVDRNLVKAFSTDVKGIGHYTQVVWATTTRVGCAFIKYHANGEKYIYSYLACNYGEAGNWDTEPIYKTY